MFDDLRSCYWLVSAVQSLTIRDFVSFDDKLKFYVDFVYEIDIYESNDEEKSAGGTKN
jgi:hypothetical protein